MVKYHSKCTKCGWISYLSVGRDYICNNPNCKFIEKEEIVLRKEKERRK